MTKEEFFKKVREPPKNPAFANDGKNLNLETHDMLLKIINYKFTVADAGPGEGTSQ